MRTPLTALALLLTVARDDVHAPASRPVPVRLSAGASDTILVNERGPVPLRVRALDAAGRPVAGAPIRFAWTGGARVAVSPTGTVTCGPGSGDARVRATLTHLTLQLFVRCRPVELLRLTGPVEFVLGDSVLGRPRPLPLEAYGPDGRRVLRFAGSADVRDRRVAEIVGAVGSGDGRRTIVPRSPGITLMGASVGDRSAATGLYVYHRVQSLAALDTLLQIPDRQRLVAAPLRLARGDMYRQRLPPGSWMLTMRPAPPGTTDDGAPLPKGLRLRVEGAACTPLFNTPRRFGCSAGPTASVIIYHPGGAVTSASAADSIVTGELFVRWMFP